MSVCALLTLAIIYTMYSSSSTTSSDRVEMFESEAAADKQYENRLFVLKMLDSLGRKPSPDELDRLSSMDSRVKIMQHLVREAEVAETGKEPFSERRRRRRAARETAREVDQAPEGKPVDEVFGGPVDDVPPSGRYHAVPRAHTLTEAEHPSSHAESDNESDYESDYESDNERSTLEPTGSRLEPTGSTLEPTGSTLEPTGSTLEPSWRTLHPDRPVTATRSAEHPGKRHVRDMYALLGKLDEALS